MAAKILVVDDDPNVQRLLQYTLKQEGYDVDRGTGRCRGIPALGRRGAGPDPARRHAAQARRLPGRDQDPVRGGQRQPRPDHHAHRRAEVEQKVRGLRAGADDYLIKPFHPAELLARIKSLLARFAPKERRGPSAARARPRVLRRQGRRRDDDHRDQRRHRAPSRARAQGLPRRRQPAVRRPPRLPRPRARPQEHRRRRVRADDRRRPHPPGHGQARLGHRPAARAAVARRRPSWSDPSTCRSITEQLATLYDYILIDVDKRLDDINLGVFEAAETVFVVMTADLSCLKNVRLIIETMDHLGYPADKVQLVLNRSNAFTGINVKNAEGALQADDRAPDRQRVPRRDQRAQLGRAVHVHQGRLGARGVAAPFRPGGRQAGRAPPPRSPPAPDNSSDKSRVSGG